MVNISTVLIAVKSEVFSEALADELCQGNQVHICHSGITALELLDQVRPDALVLDLCLPHMTGIDVLKGSTYLPRVILGITNIVTDAVIEAARSVGINYLFLIPCKPRVVASHLLELLNSKEKAAP